MDHALFYAAIILRETPAWAYVVLLLLFVLGTRRIKSRSTSLVGLAVVPIVFLAWSIVGAVIFGNTTGYVAAASLWLGCLLGGLLSFRLIGPPQGHWTDRQRFTRTGSLWPLIVYVGIFFFRYSLEIWAGFVPQQALVANGLAVTVSGVMAGRTLGDLAVALRLREAII
jgi:hypothetical protein